MSKELEELLENCMVYKYNKNNLIYKNPSFSIDQHLLYKELITITSLLSSLNINYEIDIDNNILLSL